MNQTELNKYKAMLEAKQTELSAGLRNREDIAIEKTPDAIDEVQLAGEPQNATAAGVMKPHQLIALARGRFRKCHRRHREGACPIVHRFLVFARIGNPAPPQK